MASRKASSGTQRIFWPLAMVCWGIITGLSLVMTGRPTVSYRLFIEEVDEEELWR